MAERRSALPRMSLAYKVVTTNYSYPKMAR
jgi:hypothetical protein